jgi:hypothetical protein
MKLFKVAVQWESFEFKEPISDDELYVMVESIEQVQAFILLSGYFMNQIPRKISQVMEV